MSRFCSQLFRNYKIEDPRKIYKSKIYYFSGVLHCIRPDLSNFEMFCIYILKSQKNKSYYVGSRKNIEGRLNQHNKGLVKSTKRYAPWDLAYFEYYDNLKKARKKELQIKSWKKRSAIENLMKHFKIFNKSRILDNFGGLVV